MCLNVIFLTWLQKCIFSTGFIIKQQLYDKDVPTPLLLYEFLQTLPVVVLPTVPDDDDDDDDVDEVFNPWKESDDAKVNNTIVSKLSVSIY